MLLILVFAPDFPVLAIWKVQHGAHLEILGPGIVVAVELDYAEGFLSQY